MWRASSPGHEKRPKPCWHNFSNFSKILLDIFRTGAIIAPVTASVAHLVERHLAKVEVASSSLVTRSSIKTCPIRAGFFFFSAKTFSKILIFTIDFFRQDVIITPVAASVAHLVERHLAKVEVASSSLVTRSSKDPTRNRVGFFYSRQNSKRKKGNEKWNSSANGTRAA